MWVTVLDDWTQLNQYVEEWDDLAAAALEPNPFYESWMLLPALESFGKDAHTKFALVFAPNPARKLGPPILCGFFPLVVKPRYRGLPIRHYGLWAHKYLALCTPLLRGGYAVESLGAFFDWLATNPDGCSLIELGFVSGGGLFNEALVDSLNQNDKSWFVSDCFTRALFRPRCDAEAYMSAALRGIHRKDLRRREKRLAETGKVEYTSLDAGSNIDSWINDFMAVEAGGWKGNEGSALASNNDSRSFFVRVAREGFSRGRIMMLSLRVDGQPIAVKFNLLAQRGAFALKIGYDEGFARYSPGLLLEVENIRRLHNAAEVEWMDSCAVADHAMINRLWLDRRVIQTLLIPTGQGAGEFLVSLMPLARWFNRRMHMLKRCRQEQDSEERT
jgi:hypothetical protein